MARKNCTRVDLAARPEGAGGCARLEHGAEGGGGGREPGGCHASESLRCGSGARVADLAGKERVPGDGVARGHFVEQTGRGARKAGFRVGREERGGRDGAGEGR